MDGLFRVYAAFLIVFLSANCGNTQGGTISEHFDGSRFFNSEKEDRSGEYTFIQRLRWLRSTKLVEWPEWIEDPVRPIPPKQVENGELRITHINQATILIQINGVNILTDPIWSERASVVSWAGPKRVRAPGVKMEDLPRIDYILISHDHYDHLDIATLKQLTKKHNPILFAGLGVKRLLESAGMNGVIEMDWWQEYDSLPNDLKIIFVPARHSSGRGLLNRNRTLWGGFVIQSPSGNVYFAGDTAYGEFLTSLKERFGGFRLALLPLGHYEPRWMMRTVHMSPDDAVKLHKFMNSKQSVGMHYGTFHGFGGHNNERVDEHENDLQAAFKKYGVSESEFPVLGFGEGRDIP